MSGFPKAEMQNSEFPPGARLAQGGKIPRPRLGSAEGGQNSKSKFKRPPRAGFRTSAFSSPSFAFARKRAGFTLIEIIVYIAILAALSAVAVNTLLLIHASLAEIRVTRSLNATGALAMERAIRVIRDSAAVNLAASTLGLSPGVLSLTGSETPALTHRLSWQGFALAYEEGTNPAVFLSPPGVLVTSLIFRATTTPVSEAVRVEVRFEASTGRATTSQTFYGTAVLRNSYAQ